MLLSNGTAWEEIDVSTTISAQAASNISFTPTGAIASNNVQTALAELDTEKLALAGGTVTGELLIGAAGSLVFEGTTADGNETTLAVTDPTADRTITLPNVTGTVITTGDSGTVTSTMILDGTIVNADINASAAIADTKLATIATALKVSNSATTAASANTASAIVARDGSGNFTAGTITAALTGAASSNVLKVGDTMTGPLITPLGSVGVPSITFTGDTNTGIYSPGADQLAVSTGGTGRLFVDASGNVGVGTGSPVTALQVVGVANIGDGIGGRLRITTDSNLGFIDSQDNTSTNWQPLLERGTDIQFHTNTAGVTPVEKVRIDSSGRLLVGTSTARSNFFNTTVSSVFQIEGASSSINDASRFCSHIFGNNDIAGPSVVLGKHRSNSVGGNTAVQSGDQLGGISFQGSDGTEFVPSALIIGEVDGTPGADDMPGRLVFSVTADGAASPTEALRISNDRSITVSDGGNVVLGTTTGTKIGTATTQKIGFYNATPVVQPTAVADATDAATVITQLNALLAKLRTLGIIAT
jgi:hypothetical protein